MKKVSKILLIVLLIGLLATAFSACSVLSKFQYSAPSDVNGGQGSSSDEKYDEKYPAYLSFTYLTQAPSVFKHIYIDEFKLENVQYQVTYYVNKTDPVTQDYFEDYITYEDPKPVTEDMLDNESLKNLKVAGHHNIKVSTTITFEGEEVEVEGAFPLHLKERSQIEFVTLTFNLNGGNALFGSTNNDVATIKVVKGTSYSASDFFSTFNAVKEGYALSEWSGFNGSITVDGNKTFTAKWTNDIIKVSFDLNLPDGVAGNASAYTSEPVTPSPQNVQKNKGIVPRPSLETFANLTGYTFIGWFTSKTGGENWNFNESVGSTDFTLYARWKVKTCSITYILMGGVFDESKSDTTAQTKTTGQISYVNGLEEGDIGYDPNYTSNFSKDCPFMFTIEGMTYNKPYADYYVEFAPKRNAESTIKVSASPENLTAQLKKGDGYYYISGWYESPTYEEETRYSNDKVSGDVVLYARWEINPEILNPTTTAQIEKSEKYFSEYIYNYSVKADGSVRIDLVRDSAVSTLVIPENIDGKPVSEFGAQAGMNLKSLVKLDTSRATNLVSIGKQAFYNSYALKDIVGAVSNIAYIGEDAFKGTQWLNDLADQGKFAVVGSVLVKCFDFENESVNVDTGLPELSSVSIIAGGAFKDNYTVKSVTIGDGIKQIDNGAFYNCINLETVTGANGVEKVGETAFGNTKFIINAPADDVATPNVDESTFIKVGKVYYRHIAPNDKSAVIPATVKYIAPHAFATTPAVETIRFEDASQIVNVGEEAFSGTLWLAEDCNEEETSLDGSAGNGTYIKDGFIVINHILVGYTKKIVNNGEQNWSVAFVPDNIKVIASHAFSGYSNAKLTNIVISGGDLEKIESEAFYGASSLTRISFTETSGAALVEIFADTFSGANGGLVNESLKIYLYADALAVVPTTDVWSFLYNNSLDADGKSTLFKELKTENVSINSNIVPSVYVYDGVGSDEFFFTAWDNAGILDSEKKNIVNGVSIRRSDMVQSVEDLPVSAFGNGQGYDKESRIVGGGTLFSVLYAGKQISYPYTIYPAIKEDTIKLYKNGSEINALNPLVFYNTQKDMDTTGLELRFEYNASVGGSTQGSLAISNNMVEYSGYSIAIGDNKPLSVSINYYGLMKYNKTFVYSTKLPADAAIEQVSTMTMALDAIPTGYFQNVYLLVTAKDGSTRYDTLSSRNAKIISYEDYLDTANRATADEYNLDTSTVGFKFAGVRYGDGKGNFIYCKLVYSVILSADVKQLTYKILNAEEHTAVVAGLNSGYNTTITIPVSVALNSSGVATSANTEIYTIVGIADGAFKDKTALEYVYIPTTVTSIGKDAFSGCTSLKNVYSFAVQEGEFELGINDVEVLSASQPNADNVVTGKVMIKDHLATSGTIVVVPTIIEFVDNDITYKYTVSALSKNAFDQIYDNGCRQIYLPSSLEIIGGTSAEVYGGHANDVEVFVYDSAENNVFYSVNRFSSNIVTIGDRAFYGCSSLENLDLSQATALTEIGSFAFYGCSSMTEIDLSATMVKNIAASTFASCTKLEFVTFAVGTEIIENNAFENCFELNWIENAESVWFIGNQAFHACAKFVGFTSPIAIVGQSAFEGCAVFSPNIDVILVASESAITNELEGYIQATESIIGRPVTINGNSIKLNGTQLYFVTNTETEFNFEGATTRLLVYYW